MENQQKTENDEVFKTCPCDIMLEVSQYGKIREKGGNILQPFEDKGYLFVNTTKGKNLVESVHRLVALTWLDGGDHKGMYVHHKDENKLNNRADNLQWMTENEHMQRHGAQKNEYGDWILGL
jgi:hypothetical protein